MFRTCFNLETHKGESGYDMPLKCSMIYSNFSSPVSSWSEATVVVDHVRTVNGQPHSCLVSVHQLLIASTSGHLHTAKGAQCKACSWESFPQAHSSPNGHPSCTLFHRLSAVDFRGFSPQPAPGLAL